MTSFQEIREKVNHQIYKVDSVASQRNEACSFAEAIYHNSGIDRVIDWDHREAEIVSGKLKAEIERSALMLILERDKAKAAQS